ncbi:Domain of unknown function DUF4253 [Propionibacterium ruminifibrarum]|uniref:DUF4253 domain-containing protein n=1 Tax=Propionibacterium ruminifibrarum TaxID=1962131 RepID=A0A375I541_9ACTN|nr:Domain of unknown function DUF4253 [Propionibacterium ruminifibrarum]
MSFRSPSPGTVPPEGPLRLCGIDLPSGVHLGPFDTDRRIVPLAWMTAEPVEPELLGAWMRRLAADFGRTGLWPVALAGFAGDLERPWRNGELFEPGGNSDFDVEDFLLSPTDPQDFADPDDMAAHLGNIAPIAAVRRLGGPVEAPPAGADELIVPWNGSEPLALGLVPATSPAGALSGLGWWGPTNYGLEGEAIARIAASWQERYHLTLVGIGFDTLTLQLPPDGLIHHELMDLLAEVYRVCPDDYEQSDFHDLESYIEFRDFSPVLGLWWD